MKHSEITRHLLTNHFKSYPLLQIQDVFKYIYQSTFGCGHMVSSLEASIDYVKKEAKLMLPSASPLTEALDGEYSRVNLSYLNNGLGAETLGKLFFYSAQAETEDKSKLEEKLNIAKQLVAENKLPFTLSEFNKSADKWKSEGYPSIHHSDAFKSEYHPAYRVISNKYIPFLPLLAKLESMPKDKLTLVAIEGGSASGKTTLGETLKKIYNCTVLHTDDFFLRPEQRTPNRLAQIGGNIDYERFLEEVLIPLKNNQPINYRKVDCSTLTVSEGVKIIPENPVIVEGAYSMHPKFENFYDFSAFLDVDTNLQKERISKRNSPQTANRFFTEWIPLEQTYFSKTEIKKRCNMIIKIY